MAITPVAIGLAAGAGASAYAKHKGADTGTALRTGLTTGLVAGVGAGAIGGLAGAAGSGAAGAAGAGEAGAAAASQTASTATSFVDKAFGAVQNLGQNAANAVTKTVGDAGTVASDILAAPGQSAAEALETARAAADTAVAEQGALETSAAIAEQAGDAAGTSELMGQANAMVPEAQAQLAQAEANYAKVQAAKSSLGDKASKLALASAARGQSQPQAPEAKVVGLTPQRGTVGAPTAAQRVEAFRSRVRRRKA